MNKTARTAKVYALSLSLIFLVSVLIVQGNSSIFLIQPAHGKGCSDKSYTKDKNYTKFAGERVTLKQNTTLPLNLNFTQNDGPNVFNGSKSIIATELIFYAPKVQNDTVIGFNLTSHEGSIDISCNITYLIVGNHKPSADAGEDLNIKLNSNACKQRSNSSIFLPFNLIGIKSTDIEGPPITYLWTQIQGPQVALYNSSSSIANFRIDICTLEESTTLEFNLEVIDKMGLISNDQVKIGLNMINPSTSPSSIPHPQNESGNNRQQISNISENKKESELITTLADILNTFHPISPR